MIKQKRLSFRASEGTSLIELMLWMSFASLILICVFNILISALNIWRTDLGKIEMQQELKFAVDSMANDIAYAKQISIKYREIDLVIDQNGSDKLLIYRLDNNVRQCHLMRDNQPVTGESMLGNVSIITFDIMLKNDRTVIIYIEAIDTIRNYKFSIHTAATLLQKEVKFVEEI